MQFGFVRRLAFFKHCIPDRFNLFVCVFIFIYLYIIFSFIYLSYLFIYLLLHQR